MFVKQKHMQPFQVLKLDKKQNIPEMRQLKEIFEIPIPKNSFEGASNGIEAHSRTF